MPKLSAQDVDSILEISGLAQESASESQFPAVLFQRMTDLFGSKSAVFYSMGDDLGGSPLWNGFGFKVDAGSVRRYERRYLAFDPCFNGLRRRERDIVHQVCRGLTSLQMAAQLGISVKTVEHHMIHIYKKTQVCNRTELIRQLSF